MITAILARKQTTNAKAILSGIRDQILTSLEAKIDDRSKRSYDFLDFDIKGDLYLHEDILEDLVTQSAARKIGQTEIEEAFSESTKRAVQEVRHVWGFTVVPQLKNTENKFQAYVTLKISW